MTTNLVSQKHQILDLRSDFLTRPTPEMIKAMVSAAQERGGFGLREDQYVKKLEQEAADITGKEDALFCASCGMANQIAIHLRCRSGSTLVAEADSHVISSEAGGPAALSGVMCKGIPGYEGIPDFDAVSDTFESRDAQRNIIDLFIIENTHVRTGGALLDLNTLTRLRDLANRYTIPVHLDGSRIFNASTALNVSVAKLCSFADSVAFSLNKGLGAPLGAMLTGSASFIAEAVRVRQMFGGGWRPAGVIAAAGSVALATMPQRLGHDHEVAQQLGAELEQLKGLRLGQSRVWTNLILVDIDERFGGAAAFADVLSRHGVLAIPFGKHRLRIAIYYEIGKADIPIIVDAFRKTLASYH